MHERVVQVKLILRYRVVRLGVDGLQKGFPENNSTCVLFAHCKERLKDIKFENHMVRNPRKFTVDAPNLISCKSFDMVKIGAMILGSDVVIISGGAAVSVQ